ncbi:MAG: FAD-dependent oxidoreductase, partial [Candidatus Aminicenantes bacterium]|nr:FAD-dependent oxidoreductase [Candidatus Aminicenantes bacterium]
MMNEHLETDVLIIGSGIAGSSAALILAEAGIDTILISKGKDFSETNTHWAQGGIACLGQNEKAQDFINDILK